MRSRELLDGIARAVLYEGYLLYPYRPSSLKNSRRTAFGILYPDAWTGGRTGSDRSYFHMECLLHGANASAVSGVVRFLQLGEAIAGPDEAVEREASFAAVLGDIEATPERWSFEFGDAIKGEIEIRAESVAPGTFKLTVHVRNKCDSAASDHAGMLRQSLVSAHAALMVTDGQWISMTDPPAKLADNAARCINTGVWPVLIGAPGDRETILACPIILPDYPSVAPESPRDLYDSTEIDEILTLRILTMTDDERAEIRASESRARNILEHAESLPPEHMMLLHGAMRETGRRAPRQPVETGGAVVRPGDRVVLRPSRRADAFDMLLQGRIAIVTDIEQDFEDNVHIAVVIEDDPGRDLGEMRQSGHRFFFAAEEIEPLAADAPRMVEP